MSVEGRVEVEPSRVAVELSSGVCLGGVSELNMAEQTFVSRILSRYMNIVDIGSVAAVGRGVRGVD